MHRLDKDATIYSFTLVKRIRHRPMPLLLYGILPLPAAIFWIVSVEFTGLFWIAGGLLGIPLLHSFVTALYLKAFQSEKERGGWSMILSLPWVGFLPVQHTALGAVRRIHRHVFWVSLAFLALLFPWVPLSGFALLTALHVWFMIPRFLILALLSNTKRSGLIKINRADTSFYTE